MKALTLGLFALLLAALVSADTRHAVTVRQFKTLTGYPHGRPGYVADHLLPLCLGGPDAVSNLVWELVAESYQKDIVERRMCAAAKQQGYVLVKVAPKHAPAR